MMKKILFFLPLIFLIFCKKETKLNPIAQNGILDLRSWNFKSDGSISLDGEWNFYWKKFVSPDSISPQQECINISKYWNKQKFDSHKLPNLGYATYHLRILLPDSSHWLGLYMKEVQCAYTCYLNGIKIKQIGSPGSSYKTEIPDYNYTVLPIIDPKDTLDLVFHVSNFHHRNAGFFRVPEIGSMQKIMYQRFWYILLNLFLFSSLIVLGVYHFFLYLNRRETGAFLWFSIFSFILAFRTLFTGIELFKYAFPDTPWAIAYRIKYATLYLLVFSFTKYIYELRKISLNKILIRIFFIVPVLMLFLLFLPATIYTHSLDFIGLWVIFGFLYLSYDIIRNRNKNIIQSGVLFFSILLILFASVNDILVAQKIYNGIFLLSIATIIFLFGQADILVHLVNKSFDEVTILKDKLSYQNQHLEELITNREETIKKNYKNIIDANIKLEAQQNIIKKQLKKIRLSKENYRNTLDFMPQILVECTAEGKIVFANLKFFEQNGFTHDDFVSGINLFDFVSEKDSRFIKKELKMLHTIHGEKISMSDIKGNKLRFAVFISVLNQGNIYSGFRGIFIDISKQEELEKHSIILEQSINKSNIGVILSDKMGNLEYVNQGITNFLDKNIKEQPSDLKNIFETSLIEPLLKEKLKETIAQKKNQKIQLEIFKAEKQKIWSQVFISHVIEDGEIAHLLIIFNDINKEKELEFLQASILKQLKQKIKDVFQSIEYAKFIQTAILPSNENFTELFKEQFFIINKPLNIVSGDFYFLKRSGDRIIVVLGDSTGHGVPGALMSILGITLLSDITDTFPNILAADILELIRIKIIKSLSHGNKLKLKDSIDMAICIFDFGHQELNFSGANRPILLCENEQIERIKPIKQSLGSNHVNLEFENHYAPLKKGSRLYLYSDGITDQFGGEHDKKYGTQRFTNLIQKIQVKEINEQQKIINAEFESWKGGNKQIDDILIIGIEIG